MLICDMVNNHVRRVCLSVENCSHEGLMMSMLFTYFSVGLSSQNLPHNIKCITNLLCGSLCVHQIQISIMHLISTILSSTTFHFIGYCVHTAAYLFVSAKKAQFPTVVAHLR